MGLEKSIERGKERRKEYRDGDPRSVDTSCHNHGSCPWCKGNRTHSARVQEEIAKDKIKEYEDNPEPLEE